MAINTGYKGWANLEEFDTFTGAVTGNTKPNEPSDPDYVPPVWDPVTCSPQQEVLLLTTNTSGENTNLRIWINQYSGSISSDVYMVSKKGTTVLNEQQVPTGGSGPYTFNMGDTGVSVYVKASSTSFAEIKEISIDGIEPMGADWGINSISPTIFPNLEKLTVSNQNSLTSVNISTLVNMVTLELHDDSISGSIDISMMPDLQIVRLNNNDITSVSALTNNPAVAYYNVQDNINLSGSYDFTSCHNITQIWASRTDISNVNIVGLADLKQVEMADCPSLTTAFDFTTNTSIEVFNAVRSPITRAIWSANNTMRGFFIAGTSVPESDIHAGISANVSTLEAISISSQTGYSGSFNFDNAANLGFLWMDDLPSATGFSIDNTGNITNLNFAGMQYLTSLPDLGSNPLNGLVWVTGSGISPTDMDTILIHISSLGIPPIAEYHSGPGSIIYGDYETSSGEIVPTSASLSAYNDLDSRGYTLIGPVPGS